MTSSKMPRDVSSARPPEGSGAMFDAIAPRYDLLNRILSLGIDQSWRRKTAAALATTPMNRVLDIATGTGDLAVVTARQFPSVTIVGVDPSARMLDVAREKVACADLAARIELVQGDAQNLPFADDSFDGVCMAFGIRNVPDRLLALREMRRVLRPRGRVSILELSEPGGGVLGPMARFHVRTVVPWIGAALSGSREYRYLQRSIAAFPPPREFVATMQEAGLANAHFLRLSFGACHVYLAERPAES